MLRFYILVLLSFSNVLQAQSIQNSSFKVIPLGTRGGLDESNLSAYMIAEKGTENFICVDAGTLRFGIEKAIAAKLFKTDATTVMKSLIKGYLISHGHLDHVSGLIINSPEDSAKNIYAMPYVIDVFREKYFTWESWANFADQGEKPALAKYRYVPLNEKNEIPLSGTKMTVKSFTLSHASPYRSTAFLLRSKDDYLLYFGDTGSDTMEFRSVC